MQAEVGGDKLNDAHETNSLRVKALAATDDVFALSFVRGAWPQAELKKNTRKAFTPEIVCEVLNQIARTGVFWRACVSSGISPAQLNRCRHDYPEIDEMVATAFDIYKERLQEAIHERAVMGVDEPQFYKGGVCGYITRYSDRLLELHAKRHIPEYRDHTTTDLNVKGGVLALTAPAMSREEYLAARRKADAIEGEVVPDDKPKSE